MSTNKIDRTRERNDIENMDLQKRKQLFNKFQNAGGQVIDDQLYKPIQKTSVSTVSNIKRKKHSGKSSHSDNSKQMSNPFYSTGGSNNKSKNNTAVIKELPVKKDSIIKLFFVRNVCFFANVFNFFGTRFSKKFTKMTLKNIYMEVQTLKTLLDPIFKANPSDVVKFREEMIAQECVFEYELVYHAYHMFQENWFRDLNRTMAISVNDSEEIFKKVFQQLYIFQPYYKQMQMAVYTIIPKFNQFFNREGNIVTTRKIINSIFVKTWNEWFVWVEELITYYWVRSNVIIGQQTLIEFLNITPSMISRIGQLSAEWMDLYHKNSVEIELEADEEKTSIPVFPSKEIEAGIETITDKVNFSTYKELFSESRDLRSLFTLNDKLFYTYVLLDSFDKKYTGLWNSINLYIIPGGATGRFDAKKEMKLLINRLYYFYELINEYLRFIKTNNILLVEDKKSHFQYNEKKNKELARKSFNIRKNIAEVLELYTELLRKIIDSKSMPQGIVGNWNDTMVVKDFDGRKYDQTVEDTIGSAHTYLSAMIWLLKQSDLSGLSPTVSTMDILTNDLIELMKNL